MRVLWAALMDLWHFVVGASPRHTAVLMQSAIPVVELLPPVNVSKVALPARPAAAQIVAPEVLPQLAPPLPVISVGTAQQPRAAETTVRVHTDPVDAFDNVLTSVPYGTPLTVHERRGRWSRVSAGSGNGWVLTDAIGDTTSVLPSFRVGHRYEAESSEARMLRACIADTFNASAGHSMLTGVEYVTYRLWLQGRQIPWPQAHSRVAGTWQRKLRGVRGVHIDILPHTGAVMEYIIDDVGYVAYVEKVAPDLKITVSGIGLTYEGQYTEQVWRHEAWREFHPVFIQVG